MLVISFVNQKGGSGKSPAAVHTSFALAREGKRVLFVDADAQGTASLHFLGLGHKDLTTTLFNAITSTRVVDKITKIEPIEVRSNLHLLPAHDELEQAEVLLTSPKNIRVNFDYRYQLKKLLQLYPDYDYVVIDTPGYRVSAFLILALVAADIAIVPLVPTLDHLAPSRITLSLLDDVKGGLNPHLTLFSILPNRYDGTQHHQDVMAILKEDYPSIVWKPTRKTIKYADALAAKIDIRELDPELGEYWSSFARHIIERGAVKHA